MEFTPEEIKWMKKHMPPIKLGDVVDEMNARYPGYVWIKMPASHIDAQIRQDFQKYGSLDPRIIYDPLKPEPYQRIS